MRIVLDHINRRFREPVLKDISYTFEGGKLYVIKGISGCGKTTLLNILGGLDVLYEGSFSSEAAESAIIYQQSLLLSGMTARENLLFIRSDPAYIEQLAARLGISQLLDRLPGQLSGGERQRVSVARALLKDPQLLLADEPTASLDAENAAGIAALIASLKAEKRIIIVATHEDCFDSYADEILSLSYGVLKPEKSEQKEMRQAEVALPPETAADAVLPKKGSPSARNGRPPFAFLLRCLLKRRPELFTLRSLLPMAFAFFLLLTAGVFQSCFAREALRFYARQYPVNLVSFTEEQLASFPHPEWLTVYDYRTLSENGLTAYSLLPAQDSVLNVKGMLEAGRFPSRENEVILTQEAAALLFPDLAFSECIGKMFVFGRREWKVSAVTIEQKAAFQKHFSADIYYRGTEKAAVFIPYSAFREISEASENSALPGFVECVVQDMGTNAERRRIVESVLAEGKIPQAEGTVFYANLYLQRIDTMQKQIERSLSVLYALFLTAGMLVCIYMGSIIRSELFYRRKEIAYLQVFGAGQKTVFFSLFAEHLVRVAAAFLLAVILWLLLAAAYGVIFQGFLYPSRMAWLSCLLVSAYYLLFTGRIVKRFLKKSVWSLLYEMF